MDNNILIMKKFVLALVTLIAASAVMHAQYASPQFAHRSGSTIKLDNEKLSQDEAVELVSNINGTDYSEDWCKARGWRTAGIVMMSAGGGVAVGGLATALLGALVSVFGATAGATVGAAAGSVGGEESAQKTGQEAAQKGAQAGPRHSEFGKAQLFLQRIVAGNAVAL